MVRPSRSRLSRVLTASAALLFAAATVDAAGTPEQQCQGGKNKTAGKYAACRENAEAKLATSGDATKYGEAITKCAAKFATAWQKLENKAVAAGTVCPSVGDATVIDGKVTATTDTVATLVSGVRFEDNGDGTVTDHQTGLQWEQKTTLDETPNLADPHDADNIYTWNTTLGGTAPNGTIFTDFLDKLNGGLGANSCFAGTCDWRLPTIVELQAIALDPYPCGTSPCIDPIFGPTFDNFYWSSTTVGVVPGNAWRVDFYDAYVEPSGSSKSISKYARAVRGGS